MPEEQFTLFFSYFSNFLVRHFTGGGSWFNKIPIGANMFRYTLITSSGQNQYIFGILHSKYRKIWYI